MNNPSSPATFMQTREYLNACTLVGQAAAADKRGSVLCISPPAIQVPNCRGLNRDEHSFGLGIRLCLGGEQPDAAIQCNSAELPFQDAVFHTVLLFMVTAAGEEPELQEACRVLAQGGELLVLGVNGRSWSGFKAGQDLELPRLSMDRLKSRLDKLSMVVDHVAGSGLLGRQKPDMHSNRLSLTLLPFADILLLRARHCDRSLFSRLSVKKFSANVIPTAISSS